MPTVGAARFRQLALFSALCYAALVLTGGAVRLTDSGLGCADWPNCSKGHVIAQLSFHPLVEDTNRLISGLVTVVTVALFLAAWRRRPFRRDLVRLSGGVAVGYLLQIPMGAIVVYTKLDPYLVALHFLLTLAILALAIVVHHRSGTEPTRGEAVVDPTLLWLARVLVAATCLVLVAGTAVTGSGPHAGGPGAKRIPVAFESMAQLHSDVALFLIGLTLATVFAFHQAKAPAAVKRRAQLMLEVMAAQGALGYTQYFLHDAAGVIELHLLGATTVFAAVLVFYLGLHRYPAEVAVAAAATPERSGQPFPPSVEVVGAGSGGGSTVTVPLPAAASHEALLGRAPRTRRAGTVRHGRG